MSDDHKRMSFAGDRKRSSFAKGSCETGKIPMKQILTAPSQSHSRMNPIGQIFLCLTGSLIMSAICVWLVFFNKEGAWKNAGISIGAACFAVLFAVLALIIYRRLKNPPEPEPLPDLSQRRSTIGARVSKRSIAASGIGGSEDSPSQVLVVNETQRSSLTA